MEKEHYDICRELEKVSCLPGTWDKRFIQSVIFGLPEDDLTEKQQEWIYRLVYKYRKQIPICYAKHQNNPLCTRL